MSIYREEILDHYKNPRNFGTMVDADVHGEEENMPCGDRLTMSLHVEGDRVQDVKFSGVGCALSIACTSLLTEKIIGKQGIEIEAMKESDILALVGGIVSPGRLNCVLLGWKVLQKAIISLQEKKSPPRSGLAQTGGVTRDMNLGEIATRWPAARSILLDYGMHCVGCFASSFDTLEQGARVHGMSDQEIDEMMNELNRAIVAIPHQQ